MICSRYNTNPFGDKFYEMRIVLKAGRYCESMNKKIGIRGLGCISALLPCFVFQQTDESAVEITGPSIRDLQYSRSFSFLFRAGLFSIY